MALSPGAGPLGDMYGISTYEKKRLQNVQDNANFFSNLGILELKNEIKLSKTKLKASRRGVKEKIYSTEKRPLLPKRTSRRLQGMRPIPVMPEPVVPEPVVPESVDDEPRRQIGQLEMKENFLAEHCLEDHEDLMSKLKGFVHKEAPQRGDNSKNIDLTSFMEDFSKMRLRADRVANVVPSRVYSLDIHPSEDRVLVVAGDRLGAVGLWDVMPGRDHVTNGVMVYTPHLRSVNCLRFSPWNSALLYSCSSDGTLRVGDFQKEVFSEVYSTEEHANNLLRNFDFLAESTLLVSQQDGTVALVDRRAAGAQHQYKLHFKPLRTVSTHPVIPHIIATASLDGTVSLWDNRNLKSDGSKNEAIAFVQHPKGVSSAYFSPLTGKYILATSLANKISVFDSSHPETSLAVLKSCRHNNQVGSWVTCFRASWHPRREDMFVVGSMKEARQIELYDETCEALTTFQCPDNLRLVCSLNAIHPTRNILVGAANTKGRVHVFM